MTPDAASKTYLEPPNSLPSSFPSHFGTASRELKFKRTHLHNLESILMRSPQPTPKTKEILHQIKKELNYFTQFRKKSSRISSKSSIKSSFDRSILSSSSRSDSSLQTYLEPKNCNVNLKSLLVASFKKYNEAKSKKITEKENIRLSSNPSPQNHHSSEKFKSSAPTNSKTPEKKEMIFSTSLSASALV